jgi:endonuclease V-like protein UPF0215 family
MKPLGRFFQVTETVDAGKYFLDIDKVQRYPITFVIKSNDSTDSIIEKITKQATERYSVKKIIQRYLNCIEEVINSDEILYRLEIVISQGKMGEVIQEIITQSRVEFNVEEDGDEFLIDEEADIL